MGLRRGERILTLTRVWPHDPMDLAYAGLGAFAGRRSANGYDPMVPLRNRAALGGMGPGGMLLGAFLRTDPVRIEGLGIRWVQVHAAALRTAGNRWGLGDTLDLELNTGEPRLFPLPIAPATEVRVGSSLSEAVGFPDGEPVARVSVRLASGRDLPLLLRAGRDTAEWAYDRADVRPVVAHRRAPIYESFPVPGAGFEGHRYLARLALPGRYYVSGIRIERLPGGGRLTLRRLGVVDTASGQPTAVSLAAAFVSDPGRFREAAATPFVRLYEVPQTLGHARVVERLRVLDEDAAVLEVLAAPSRSGVDLRREAVAVAAEVAGLKLPPASRASRAEVVRASWNNLDLRAAGPGLVVVAESWDPGWSATVDDRPEHIARVNHAQMGIVVPEGTHRITLRHRARGFGAGLLMAATAALGLAVAVAVQRRV